MALGNNLDTTSTKKSKAKPSSNGTSESGNGHNSAQEQAYEQAVNGGWASIEFEPNGTILKANDNFLNALGYAKNSEVAGKHHQIFCDEEYAKSAAYKKFWKDLAKGEVQSGEFRRIRKDGKDVWINASYTPVTDSSGKVYKVIKIAANITDMMDARLEGEHVQAAVDSGWASIEFEPNGIILDANENWVKATGYSNKSEIVGQHHRVFCSNEYAQSSEYKKFWNDLANGQIQSGEFLRQLKDGSDLWIQASYTPVKNNEGDVVKVIKIATDITAMIDARLTGENIQAAVDSGWASIEFEPNGTILNANENWIKTTGYSDKSEIVGQHHRIFCSNEYAQSSEYKKFWNDLANGQIQSGEFLRQLKDGSDLWINASYTPVKDINGNVVKVIKIASKITDMIAARLAGEHVQAAVDSGWASIEFEPNGTILNANDNWIKTTGYSDKSEIVGQHHRIFCSNEYAQSSEYKKFWNDLANGQIQSGEFLRQVKDGSDLWIQASYTPVRDKDGNVVKVIKIATNITDMIGARLAGEQVQAAVDAGWASIEFEPNGTILNANDNWITTTGYSNKSEIVGQHHRIFCSNEYAQSSDYKNFWQDLANGKTQSGEFLRQVKDGSDLWIQASYTPVKDADGSVMKVIKIATDISKVKMPVMEVSEIISQMAQGDLTRNFNIPAEGYVKEMGDALNVALDNLNALLGNIEENSNLLGASSEQMLTKSDQMQGTTQEVASAIGQMAEGVQQQAEQIDESSKLLDGVRTAAIEVTDKSQEINKAAEASQSSVGVGLDTVKKVVASMTEIKESAATTSESISVLTERSEEIARTLNVITDIAAQTNLLALNAAIEAARAGDAGRGFAVVAEEIRKLAEDSRKSAGDIEKVISAVGKDIASAGKAISTMDGSVKVGNDASNDAEKVFNEISVSTEQTLKLSVDVLASADEQKNNIDDTVKNIEKIVVVSEETAAGTEEIATSSKDLNNGMDEFNSTSKSLASIAVQLQEGVSKFNLKK